MKKETMGHGAAMGLHGTNASRAYGWLWHSLMEAQRELPLLRWVGLLAVATCALAVYLAASEGKTTLDIAIYGILAGLFVLILPIIYYELFEIYRKHRSDAIFDSKRLAEHIRKIAREELDAAEGAKMALENTLLMMRGGKAEKN